MDYLPGQKLMAVAERWPLVEVRQYRDRDLKTLLR